MNRMFGTKTAWFLWLSEAVCRTHEISETTVVVMFGRSNKNASENE